MIRKFIIVAASVLTLSSTAFAQQGGTADEAKVEGGCCGKSR
jgi:predicted outer membrane protein